MELNIYDLSNSFWEFSINNPEKIKPVHVSLYFFTIEYCNRLGWKEKFGLPTSMVLGAIGIKSYSVYKKCFDDLVKFGFIKVIEYSKNQHSCNIVALQLNYKADYKADYKASSKVIENQSQSTMQSTGDMIEQLVKNKKKISRDEFDKIQLLYNYLNKKFNKQKQPQVLTWKNDFETYKKEFEVAYKEIITPEYIEERQRFHPNLDILKTLEKACKDYWYAEVGWMNKKKSNPAKIDWKATFNNSLTNRMNHVYKQNTNSNNYGNKKISGEEWLNL